MNKKHYLLFLILFFLFFLNRNVLLYRPLLHFVSTKTTTGIIVDKKDFSRRGYLTGAFTFYYKFVLHNVEYSNPSYNEDYQVGDLVKIEYSEMFPFINKIVDK